MYAPSGFSTIWVPDPLEIEKPPVIILKIIFIIYNKIFTIEFLHNCTFHPNDCALKNWEIVGLVAPEGEANFRACLVNQKDIAFVQLSLIFPRSDLKFYVRNNF